MVCSKGRVHWASLIKHVNPSDSGAMAKRRKSSSPISGKFVCTSGLWIYWKVAIFSRAGVIRKLVNAMIRRLDPQYVLEHDELLPGGDIRIKANCGFVLPSRMPSTSISKDGLPPLNFEDRYMPSHRIYKSGPSIKQSHHPLS